MTRTARTLTALVLVAVVMSIAPLAAAIKKEERSKVTMGGPLGKMMGIFMGRQMREGIVSSIAIKGDRKLTRNGDTGQLIDLAGEKVYDIDFRKKTYSVMTFEQVRQKMLEAQQKMKDQQAKMEAERAKEQPDQKAPEYDFEVVSKATGEAKAINGFQTKQTITTITMKPKGQSLEEGGGMVMTIDQWLTPKVPGAQEEVDFEMRYLKKIGMVDMVQEMAAAAAMYPGIMEAAKRAKVEGDKLDGTPVYSVSTFNLVPSAEQQKQQDKQQAEADSSGGGGGLGGMLARKMMKKKKAEDASADSGSTQSGSKTPALLTTTTEVLSMSNDATDADVALPGDFKQKNPD